MLNAIESWILYHFHDTSSSAKLKGFSRLDDNHALRPDAANLAAYLYRLKERQWDVYKEIVEVVRLVAPFFGDFDLKPYPTQGGPDTIKLEWNERGYPDHYLDAHDLSDGTLRFICLATLLMQDREDLPSLIILDEPELGLHPFAISILAEMLRAAAERTQVLVATQSVTLINHLDAADLIVVDRVNGESIFTRPDPEGLSNWLEDFALGELWEKNVLGGRPSSKQAERPPAKSQKAAEPASRN